MNTSETDRAGCKAFCGMSYPQIGIGGETETPARTAWRDSPGFLDRADLERNTRQCWCSALCRDRRYPPLPVPAKAAPLVFCGRCQETGSFLGCALCRETIAAKAAPKAVQPREAGQRWLCADGRELTLSAAFPLRNQPDAWIDTAGRLWWSWNTMTLLSPTPVAKSAEPAKPPVAQASFTGACGISMSSTAGRDISDLIKWHGDGCRECAPVAQGAKCTCPHGPHQTDGSCPIHVTAGIFGSGFVGCSCAKCGPSPAAKCCEQCRKPGPTVAKRVPPLLFYCDPCYLAREAFISGGNTTNVLHNPAIPERLTKAQLASDYYDDCLPEAGR